MCAKVGSILNCSLYPQSEVFYMTVLHLFLSWYKKMELDKGFELSKKADEKVCRKVRCYIGKKEEEEKYQAVGEIDTAVKNHFFHVLKTILLLT